MTPAELAHQLAASSERLCELLSLLEADEIEYAQLPGGWTPKVLVGHVAFWDDYQMGRMEAALRGELAQYGLARPEVDNEARAAADAMRPWATVLAEADAARRRLVDFATNLPAEALLTEHPFGDGTFSLARQLTQMVNHVRGHARELNSYCGSLQRWSRLPLRNLLVQNHKSLLDSIGGLDEETLLTTRVCGHWSMRDVLAHVLSWNEYAYLVIQQWPQPNAEELRAWVPEGGITQGGGFDAINERLMAERAHLDMIAIVDGLATYHRRQLQGFDRMSDQQLAGDGEYGWGEVGEAARFFYEFSLHELEHAEQIWRFRAGAA